MLFVLVTLKKYTLCRLHVSEQIKILIQKTFYKIVIEPGQESF